MRVLAKSLVGDLTLTFTAAGLTAALTAAAFAFALSSNRNLTSFALSVLAFALSALALSALASRR